MHKISFGDVIYVKRNCGLFGYKHFGVYSGNSKVIHYVKEGNDAFDGVIRETSFAKFMSRDADCYVCHFDNDTRSSSMPAVLSQISTVQRVVPRSSIFMGLLIVKGLYDFFFGEDGKIYSAEETVERARSQIGNRGYDLLTHNCEHFAVWCKTGVEKSEQVDEMINLVAITLARL